MDGYVFGSTFPRFGILLFQSIDFTLRTRFGGLGGFSRLCRHSRGVYPTADNIAQRDLPKQFTFRPLSPSPRSTSHLHDVVFGYEYIVPLREDFSRRKKALHIHPANKIQNQV